MNSREYKKVAKLEDLPSAEPYIVEMDNITIGIFRIDGDIYAIENKCAHQAGPVCTGKQLYKTKGEFKEVGNRVEESFCDDVPVIVCPWHGWEYSLETGEHIGDPDYAIRSFEVKVQDDSIYIRTD